MQRKQKWWILVGVLVVIGRIFSRLSHDYLFGLQTTVSSFQSSLARDCGKKYCSVLLQGQFNYGLNATFVSEWVDAWSAYFEKILVVGPFSNQTSADLSKLGIQHRMAREDEGGLVTPHENLMHSLAQYKSDASISGILYLHDDMLINLTLLEESFGFPTSKSIITTFDPDWKTSLHRNSYYIRSKENECTFYNVHRQPFASEAEFIKSLGPWFWHEKWCIPTHKTVAKDPRAVHDKDGMVYFEHYELSDVMYVPMEFADDFIAFAKPFVDNEVFLECAFPTIVHNIRQKKVTAHVVKAGEHFCTSWDTTRGTNAMIQNCINDKNSTFAFFHPVKISRTKGYWGEVLHALQKRNRNFRIASIVKFNPSDYYLEESGERFQVPKSTLKSLKNKKKNKASPRR